MISVIIPVYKNTEQLIQNLRHNLPYLKDCEVILVNDDPSKSIKNQISEFKDVILFENEKNIGFGQTVNRGVTHATGDYILLLNTDVVLKDDSYKKALEIFKKDPTLFAVSFAQEEKDKRIVGKNNFFWKKGFFYHTQSDNLEFGKNAWAEGGSCLINKNKFEELKGFDDLYSPFYWEDIDLSYRALKKGYIIIFDPDILVEHQHGGTTDKYVQSDFKDTISARNQFIFIWKNITDQKLIIEHILLLPYNLLFFFIKGRLNIIKGFFKAVKMMSSIKKSRPGNQLISDEELLKFH